MRRTPTARKARHRHGGWRASVSPTSLCLSASIGERKIVVAADDRGAADGGTAERVELSAMELRRIDSLPPYVFATIGDLALELRRASEASSTSGFGNPDLPSPEIVTR